jgi:hypothetical protein
LRDVERWHMGLLITAHSSARTFRRRNIHVLISVHRGLRYMYFITNKECIEPKMKHLLLQKKIIIIKLKPIHHNSLYTKDFFYSIKHLNLLYSSWIDNVSFWWCATVHHAGNYFT